MKKTEGETWASCVKSCPINPIWQRERERGWSNSKTGSIHYQGHQLFLSYQFLTEITASLPLLGNPLLPLLSFPRFSSNLLASWPPLLPYCSLSPVPPTGTALRWWGTSESSSPGSCPVKEKAEAWGDAETSSGHVANHSTCKAEFPSRQLMPSTVLFPLHHTTFSQAYSPLWPKKQTERLVTISHYFPSYEGLGVTVRKTR